MLLHRCKHKLQQRHALSVRTLTTLSSRQQAAHVLRVLAVAKDALHAFSTAFRLAVMLSKEQHASLTATQQQQQGPCLHTQEDDWAAVTAPQQQQQQHGSQSLSWQPLAAEGGQQTQHAGEPEGGDAAGEPPRPHTGDSAGKDGAAGQVGNAAGSSSSGGAPQKQQKQQQQQPPCAPAPPVNAVPEPAANPLATHELAAAAAAAVATAAAQPAEQIDALAAEGGPADWQHSQEGWQELLQRAWRGDVQAVLACAQQLIHGGDFCLQDCHCAEQLLRTVSDMSACTHTIRHPDQT